MISWFSGLPSPSRPSLRVQGELLVLPHPFALSLSLYLPVLMRAAAEPRSGEHRRRVR